MENISKEAQVIQKILIKENIQYRLEYIFPKFKTHKGKYYRFDFAIFKNNKLICIIEYDSKIHFQQINKFHKNNRDFLSAKERDRRKNSYCLSKGIKLYRIPFWDLSKIKTFKDLTQEKYLVKSKWHNDIIWREKN